MIGTIERARWRSVRLRGAALVPLAALLAGCWEEPVRETVTVDLRQPRRVGLSVAIELESPRELQGEPAVRRTVELAAAELLDGRHAWNERFALLDCEVESGGWQKREQELRRYELAAECADPGAFATLLADRQLIAQLEFEPGGGELRLVATGGGPTTRADRQRLERRLDEFTRSMARYVDAARAVARRAERDPRRAGLLWTAVLVEADPEAVEGLTRTESEEIGRLLDEIGELLAAFQRTERDSESLDALARRLFDPLPMRLEVAVPSLSRLEVDGFVAADAGRFTLPPRGIEAALVALEGRWFEPDPALTMLRNLRTGAEVPPDLAPFLGGSILRSEETVDGAALRDEIEASLAPPAELRLAWRREAAPATGRAAESGDPDER